ncbi:ABC transporter permease [Microbacterium hibisci]|uniref:ABC transporter permease n=1 Tax=Microbacterium hibisci TaxID=2036000 RepID=UPI0019405001|nr:ABC transporter permease [Microbacterium hibisci]
MTTTSTTISDRVSLERRVPPRGGFTLTYLWIELKRKLRSRRLLLFTVAFPVAMFVIIGLPLREQQLTATPLSQGGPSVAAYVMVSMAMYGAMMSSTQTGTAIGTERAYGWSRQLRLTPLNPLVNVVVKTLAGMVLGLLAVTATYLVGAASGVHLTWAQWIATGAASWLLASAVFTTLGLAVGYLMPGDGAAQVTSLAIALLSFLGGLFTPLSAMPELLQVIARFTPVYGISQIARAPLTGADVDILWFVNAVAWLGIFVACAAWAFRRDTKRV